jgi:hypothetical protein
MRRLAVLLTFACAVEIAAANHGLERGFNPDKLYDFGNIDAINTFNGNLTLRIPLSGTYPVNGSVGYSFGLSYNSKVWDYEQITGKTRAVPTRRANAGLGWLLSLGRLIAPTDPTNETNAWIYESPDGAIHEFNTTLNGATTSFAAPVTAVRYTNDGSYIRMLQKNDGTMDLEFPDGAVHTFTTSSGKLSRVRDRFNNSVSVAYSSSMTGTPCPSTDNYVWTFTDSKDGARELRLFQQHGLSRLDVRGTGGAARARRASHHGRRGAHGDVSVHLPHDVGQPRMPFHVRT